MRQIFLILPFLAIAGCTDQQFNEFWGITPSKADEPATEVAVEVPVTPTLDPTPPPPPPTTARTVEQFDTTSQEDREEALVVEVTATEQNLGTTIASLGSPTDPGIWLKTPLVNSLTEGRIEYQGNTITVELRPSGGAAGSGSQISLAAMRLIEAPLTGLPEVTVFAK